MNTTKKYRKYIGPSQISIALDLDDYQTSEQLKDEIENGYIPSSTYATNFGNEKESIALYYYQKLYNVKTTKPQFVVDRHNRRIGGIGDALIDKDIGLEIKCHVKDDNLLKNLPIKYLCQCAGYMYLYNRKEWRVMSCVFRKDCTLSKYTIFTVRWSDVEKKWTTEWYPKLVKYIDQLRFRI